MNKILKITLINPLFFKYCAGAAYNAGNARD
jgi:hypothetical protein